MSGLLRCFLLQRIHQFLCFSQAATVELAGGVDGRNRLAAGGKFAELLTPGRTQRRRAAGNSRTADLGFSDLRKTLGGQKPPLIFPAELELDESSQRSSGTNAPRSKLFSRNEFLQRGH